MDDDGPAEIEEVLARLRQGQDVSDKPSREFEGGGADGANDAEPEDGAKMINEITSSGMFALDGPPGVSDAEKVRFACNAVGGDGAEDDRRGQSMDKVGGAGRGYGCP
ncbi:PIF1 protein [Hirsutella rhossiliensis]